MKLVTLVLKKGSNVIDIYDEMSVVRINSEKKCFCVKGKWTLKNHIETHYFNEQPFDLRIKLGGTFALLTFYLKSEKQIEYQKKRLFAYCKEQLGF